jgi:hypothetical protein
MHRECLRLPGHRLGTTNQCCLINVWNRLNVATRQVAGEWLKSPKARAAVEAGSPR